MFTATKEFLKKAKKLQSCSSTDDYVELLTLLGSDNARGNVVRDLVGIAIECEKLEKKAMSSNERFIKENVSSMKGSEKAIKQAIKTLKETVGDSEDYHLQFDNLIEERLSELDPEFMDALDAEYERSGQSRWYA